MSKRDDKMMREAAIRADVEGRRESLQEAARWAKLGIWPAYHQAMSVSREYERSLADRRAR